MYVLTPRSSGPGRINCSAAGEDATRPCADALACRR